MSNPKIVRAKSNMNALAEVNVNATARARLRFLFGICEYFTSKMR